MPIKLQMQLQRSARPPVLKKARPMTAVEKLLSKCNTLKTQLYLTPSGEPLVEELQDIAMMFTIFLIAAERDRESGVNRDPTFLAWMLRLDEALMAIVTMSNNFFYWDPSKAILMDDGMDASVLISRKATTAALKLGFQRATTQC